MVKLLSAARAAHVRLLSILLLVLCMMGFKLPSASAVTTVQGSIGVSGTVASNPPTRAATIAIPVSGSVYNQVPISVSGLCPSGLLIKVFSNSIFMGSTICVGGSYAIQIGLFSGQNDLTALDYDSLDQVGPVSNHVNVTYNDTQFLHVGTHLQLSSVYAEYGEPPGTEIDWPVTIIGGTGPFAISVDWGDGSPQSLLSTASDGDITLKHTYKTTGIYTVVIKGVDANGETAFLQVVGQGTGAVTQNNTKSGANPNNVIIEKGGILIWPAIAITPLIIIGFWVGRRYELQEMRKKYLGFDE